MEGLRSGVMSRHARKETRPSVHFPQTEEVPSRSKATAHSGQLASGVFRQKSLSVLPLSKRCRSTNIESNMYQILHMMSVVL